MTRATGTTLFSATLRLSTVIIAIIIVTTIQNVEAKGGISRGGIFRSSSRGSYRGGGYGAGGGRGYTSGIGLRARWWMIGGLGYGVGGHHYRNRGYGNNNNNAVNSNSTESSTGDEPSRLDAIAGVSGLFYVVIFFIFALVKSSIQPGKYDQSEYSIMYFLSFLCLTAFTIIAYKMPLNKGEDDGDGVDSWDQWFESNSTFVQTGDSPLNYFDTIFCGIGMLLSTLMIVKDLTSSSGKAYKFTINLMTRICLVFVVAVFATSLMIGCTSSWKVPMILFSGSAVGLSFLRYAGLLCAHQSGLKLGAAKKRIYYWLDASDFMAGFFSILFHVLMAYTYEEASVLVVNLAAISLAGLAMVFDKIFLLQLYFGNCCQRKSRYIPNEEETLSEKSV